MVPQNYDLLGNSDVCQAGSCVARRRHSSSEESELPRTVGNESRNGNTAPQLCKLNTILPC